MHDVDVMPEIKEIVGAMLFAAKQPVSVSRLQDVFAATAEQHDEGLALELAAVTADDLEAAVDALGRDLRQHGIGLRIVSVAGGYRMENDTRCGPWLRQFLEKGKPNRLSQPALETLAIIAYRQPVVRSEIEAVRGVSVDQIVRNLLELQLIRAVGRSDLPGRPWLFGTTQRFLEHFGLRSLDDLPGVDELRRMESERSAEPAKPDTVSSGSEPAVPNEPASEEGSSVESEPEDGAADGPSIGPVAGKTASPSGPNPEP